MSRGLTSLSPLTFIRDGFDWTGRSGRAFVIVAFAIFPGLIIVASFLPAFNLARALIFAGVGLLFIPSLGHIRRRLRDLGRSGWWLWLVIGPLSILLFVYLAIKPGQGCIEDEPRKSRKLSFGFALSIATALLFFSRAFWEPYTIPAGSMKPTLMVGDYIVVSRFVVPPVRGNILVFHHPITGADYIDRLIGTPGDLVQFKDGLLHLNNEPVDVQNDGKMKEILGAQGPQKSYPRCENSPLRVGELCLKTRLIETLPNGTRYGILDIGEQSSDYTGRFKVPAGHYFFLGDNRDNSSDSRHPQVEGGIGFVPRENIVGKARFVVLSLDGVSGRFLKGLK